MRIVSLRKFEPLCWQSQEPKEEKRRGARKAGAHLAGMWSSLLPSMDSIDTRGSSAARGGRVHGVRNTPFPRCGREPHSALTLCVGVFGPVVLSGDGDAVHCLPCLEDPARWA